MGFLNMFTEDYVSFETAKLLKEKGFKEWCRQCYGLDVRHNGEPIDVDEEYELRDTGRENEIEYVDGGRMYDYGCGNFNPGSPYAAPTLQMAIKWLREVHKIEVRVIYANDKSSWFGACKPMNEPSQILLGFGCESKSYEEACEAGIKYCLENLI